MCTFPKVCTQTGGVQCSSAGVATNTAPKDQEHWTDTHSKCPYLPVFRSHAPYTVFAINILNGYLKKRREKKDSYNVVESSPKAFTKVCYSVY